MLGCGVDVAGLWWYLATSCCEKRQRNVRFQ